MVKAVVAGAAGGIGQPLSLLLKSCQHVTELALYDVVNSPGVATDLSHISTPAKVTGYLPKDDGLQKALTGADVVVIPAGIPRKPGMTRDDLFKINAGIVKGLIEGVAQYCPDAYVLIISNPVNSTVPIAAEVLTNAGKFNPKKLFGVTTLDVTRANTFVAENQGWDVQTTNVPVVGGHAGVTILPLLSQLPNAKFSEADKAALTKRIMFGGDEVVAAKAGAGSATLSMAYAGAQFANSVLRAAKGEKGIVECTFVENNVTSLQFFSSPVELGPNGVEKVLGYGKLDAFEQKLLEAALPELKASIDKGFEFVKNLPAQ